MNNFFMMLKSLSFWGLTPFIFSYPSPSSLSYHWSGGSALLFTLMMQLLSGAFLLLYFSPTLSGAWDSLELLGRETTSGSFLHSIHLTGATFFFFFIYLHIARGLINTSSFNKPLWLSGCVLFYLLMCTSFLGYVLPSGQMSLWGATVITNLISTIPMFGGVVVQWVWGGYSVAAPTVSFFFLLHFILPFLMLLLSVVHMALLHMSGSSTPMKTSPVLVFNLGPGFIIKDLLGVLIILFVYCLVWSTPWVFGDPTNWMEFNSMSSPVHIQPEWYFLFAYTILRASSNKLGGVILMILSVVMFMYPLSSSDRLSNDLIQTTLLFFFFLSFFSLTFLGTCPATAFFFFFSVLFSVFFFMFGLFLAANSL